MAALYFGSDHGGVTLRDELVAWARAAGHNVLAVSGPRTEQESCDYPDVALDVCQRVLMTHAPSVASAASAASAASVAPVALGVLVCGTGQGMAMTANKVAGIRAGVVSDPFSAAMIVAHNNANVVCFGQRVLGVEVAKLLLHSFLVSSFEGGRHERRVHKLNGAHVPGQQGS